MFDEYFETLDYLKHKFRQLKRRQIFFSLGGKITSKENMNQKKRNNIKAEINHKFIHLKRKAFASNVYLRIVYYYNDRNPPTVVNATKNMLDLLHVNINQQNTRENIGILRTRLPYYDDSQVSFLSVRQYVRTDSACSYILIENFNNVLQYANILTKLNDKNYLYGHSRSEDSDLSEENNYPIGSLGFKIEMFRRQQEILRINQMQHFYLELLYQHNKYQKRDTAFLDILLTILRYPIRVNVPISQSKQEIYEQKKIIKHSLSEFKKQYPFFNALYGPVILSVFYKPKNNIDVKDIDNFIREIVAPCFEAEFKPPSIMFDPTKEELASIRCVGYSNNLNGHIIGYDILKLPNNKHKEDEGICIIGFHMESDSDAVGAIKQIIDEMLEKEALY